eukprot:7774793-Lingulodinium_polyedra.AAC.1
MSTRNHCLPQPPRLLPALSVVVRHSPSTIEPIVRLLQVRPVCPGPSTATSGLRPESIDLMRHSS